MLDLIKHLFEPSMWLRNYPYSRAHDDAIRKIIRDDLVVRVDHYHAYLQNGVSIWIGNYPYAYGRINNSRTTSSRSTTKALNAYIFNKYLELKNDLG